MTGREYVKFLCNASWRDIKLLINNRLLGEIKQKLRIRSVRFKYSNEHEFKVLLDSKKYIYREAKEQHACA